MVSSFVEVYTTYSILLYGLYRMEVFMIFVNRTGPKGLDSHLITLLELAEKFAGAEFIITSAFRQGDIGAHGLGLAVGIKCSESRPRFRIIAALLKVGFRRLGIYDLHIHADVSLARDQEVMWMGESS